MLRSSSGLVPRRACALSATIVVLILAAATGGCSSTRSTTAATTSWPAGNDAYRVAYEPPPPKVEMEDDGMEAQVPPPKRVREEPDDPREPFSRNYGTVAPLRRAEALPVAREAMPPPARPTVAGWRMTVASGD